MKPFICRICGRGLLAEETPKYCYFDKIQQVEQISFEEARLMGLPVDVLADLTMIDNSWTPEFPSEVKFDIYDGHEIDINTKTDQNTLSELQDKIMKEKV